MTRVDRYVLSQLMVLFGFFTLILVLVYWVNRAVVLFDQLIADGQSAAVFLEFTILTLPGVITLVLPTATFAAAVYVANKLTADSELTILKATGFAPPRILRPAIIFGVATGAVMALLMHVLVPLSHARLAERQGEIAQNITARLLTEGEFLHPAKGLAFYIGDIDPDGLLRNIFLSDTSRPERHITYTASKAFLVRGDAGPRLVMVDGRAQTLATKTQSLTIVGFADFVYDFARVESDGAAPPTRIDHLTTPQLLQDRVARAENPAEWQVELHSRTAQALFCLAAAMVGFATLLMGKFSRFGVWRQILGALALLIILKLIEGMCIDAVRRDADAWALLYVPALIGGFMTATLLFQPIRRLRGVAA